MHAKHSHFLVLVLYPLTIVPSDIILPKDMPVLSWRQMEHYYRNGNGVFLGDWLAYSSPSWISNQVCLEFEVPKVTCV